MSRRAVGWTAALALAVLPVAACTYYPTIRDAGGVRLQPEEGRLVRQENANAAVFHVLLKSTGKFGDTLIGAEAPIARRAERTASPVPSGCETVLTSMSPEPSESPVPVAPFLRQPSATAQPRSLGPVRRTGSPLARRVSKLPLASAWSFA